MKTTITTIYMCFVFATGVSAAPPDSTKSDSPKPVAAIQKSIALITTAWRAYPKDEKSCFTCHNHAMPVFALNIADEAGYAIDENIIQQIATHGQTDYAKRYERIAKGNGVGGQSNSASYALTLLYASSWPKDKTTTALVDYLLINQKDDGRWQTPSHRPPSGASDFTSTALAARAIYYYATKSQQAQADVALDRAHQWMVQSNPKTNEDKTFRLLGLFWFDESEEVLTVASDHLLDAQRKDGGWSQLAKMPSDAYATGQALVALQHSGQITTNHKAYKRGLQFLLNSQHDDGSWHVVTRADPIQDYYESGFPHGDDQFISLSATSWATMALALAHPFNEK